MPICMFQAKLLCDALKKMNKTELTDDIEQRTNAAKKGDSIIFPLFLSSLDVSKKGAKPARNMQTYR